MTARRTIIAGAVALSAALACPAAAAAQDEPDRSAPPAVTIALVPGGTEPRGLARLPEMAIGVLSAGLSRVSAPQTYLDIGQGNRAFNSLYDEPLPVIEDFRGRVPHWREIVRRADSVPAEIVPGLLASTLNAHGVPIVADPLLVTPALLAADRDGAVARSRALRCLLRRCSGVSVIPAPLRSLPRLVERLEGEDLLIVLERPPPSERRTLAIGVAGSGFSGELRSDSTRTDGYVLSTDLAPTILERFGIEPPDEISGSPVTAGGRPDAKAIEDRAARMEVISERRGPVISDNLLIWLVLAAIVALLTRGAWAGPAFSLLGLAAVYLPLVLLGAAALDPSELGERLLVGLAAPTLAALTLWLVPGWGALAVACAATVLAYGVDVVAGSPLTARSLLGPNPGLGVRFFGIGNELEAVLAVAVPVGAGAALAAVDSRARAATGTGGTAAVGGTAAAAAFLAIGLVAAGVFAAGRFGADVGAAIVLPAGAVVAALAVPGVLRSRALLLLVVAVPLAALAVLAAVDLVLGGDAHLSRSVLEAGGAEELAEVAERRLRLSANSFDRALGEPLFWVAILAIVLAVAFRSRILDWLRPVPLARAGFAGACVAVALGVVANDSGATFLTIGTLGLVAVTVFAYGRHESL